MNKKEHKGLKFSNNIPVNLPKGWGNIPTKIESIMLLSKDGRIYAMDSVVKEKFLAMFEKNPDCAIEQALNENLIVDVTHNLSWGDVVKLSNRT